MKLMLLALVGAFSLSALADTRIEVTPSRPAYCLVRDYKYVNWIYDIKKVSEDDSQATFEFNVQHGSCEGGLPRPVEINLENAYVSVDRNDYFIPGLQKKGTKTSVEQSDKDELQVTVVFNKSVLFKKSPEKKLSMIFAPGVTVGYYWTRDQNGYSHSVPQYLSFWWNVKLTSDPVTKEIGMTIH